MNRIFLVSMAGTVAMQASFLVDQMLTPGGFDVVIRGEGELTLSEMLQRGDYVVPWFNDAWRFDKPVLIYWCQMASYRVLGENDFAARLPSVLFTTATARTFTARYAGSPRQLQGYVVRTYYRKQLQDAFTVPSSLLTTASMPTP